METVVRDRYSQAAQAKEMALCCPVPYNREYLKLIPQEVIDKDYGCGDPSQYVREGETVLDLGSGAGKICFIASQVVGPTGRVIGVDMNDDMLALARKHLKPFGDALGYHNVQFHKGRIQDLALDLELLEEALRRHPIQSADSFLAAQARAAELRATHPLIADESIDVVVSNCVLNLVEPAAKNQLLQEMFRVLKEGGRAVISDIVSDEPVPDGMQQDPALWSGCLSGAWTESGFLEAFEAAGFCGIQLLKWEAKPWRTVESIEFRSVTVEAFKDGQGEGLERQQAIIYKGPFKEVLDDDQRRLVRGRRYAVGDKTYQRYQKPPYREFFHFVNPAQESLSETAGLVDRQRSPVRQPFEIQGLNQRQTNGPSPCCEGGNGC